MLTDFLLGILGPVIGFLFLKFFMQFKSNRQQKILVFLLTGLTIIFYVIFGLLDYSLEEGSELNLGIFQISYGISETILILLIILIPIVLGILLVLRFKDFKWPKRLMLPTVLVLAVGSINFYQAYREYRQHHWDFETKYKGLDDAQTCIDEWHKYYPPKDGLEQTLTGIPCPGEPS